MIAKSKHQLSPYRSGFSSRYCILVIVLALGVPGRSLALPPMAGMTAELQREADLVVIVEFVTAKNVDERQGRLVKESAIRHTYIKEVRSTFSIVAVLRNASEKALDAKTKIDVHHLAYIKPNPAGGNLPVLVDFEQFLRGKAGKRMEATFLLFLNSTGEQYEFACQPTQMSRCVRLLVPAAEEAKPFLDKAPVTWDEIFPE